MKHIVGIFVIASSLAFGQATILPVEPYPPGDRYADLKTYLTLTDAQVDQLARLQSAYYQSNQTLYTEMAAKQRILYTEMEATNPNAQAAGEAVVAIARLRQQLTAAEKKVRQDAALVLTEAQKPKVQALDAARKLQPQIGQAQSLFLLDNSGYSILPAATVGTVGEGGGLPKLLVQP